MIKISIAHLAKRLFRLTMHAMTVLTLNAQLSNAHNTYISPAIPDGFGTDFHDSMSFLKRTAKGPQWDIFERLYYTHVVEGHIQATPTIPKKIHQIWLGSPLPEKCKKLQKSWIEHHPDWEYKLWTDDDIEALHLINKTAYDAATNYGAKSDIARYEILYRFGGLYIDTDFECLHSFDVLHHMLDFYTGIMLKSSLFPINNALIGSKPLHPILEKCIAAIIVEDVVKTDPNFSSGPCVISKEFIAYVDSCTDACVAFPAGYFYPWPPYHREQNSPTQIQQWIRPETFAVHHWHVSWMK